MDSINTLAWLGALAVLAGECLALMNLRRLDRLLLWSTLAEAGYVAIGLGIGDDAGRTGAVLHFGYQAVMRTMLVLAARELILATGSADLARLRGSIALRPGATLLFGFGLFAVMGLSPFKGSFSKFVILYSAIETGAPWIAVVGTIASMVAALYTIHVFQEVCLAKPADAADGPRTPLFGGLVRSPAGILLIMLAAATAYVCFDAHPFVALAAFVAGVADPHALPEFETAWPLAVSVPYVGGFVVFALARLWPRATGPVAVALAAATLVLVGMAAETGSVGDLFAVLFAAIGLAVVVYSVRYVAHSHAADRYWFFLFLMLGSLIGVATTDHLGTFYLFWELMTWTSYLLVVHEQTDKALKAGRLYFLICAGAAYVLHFGILTLHAGLGSFEIADLAGRVGELPTGTATIAILCLLVGFIAKAGLFPLHVWLPEAHPVAPSSISGPMSGILTKAGFLGILKVVFVLFGIDTVAGLGTIAGHPAVLAALVAVGVATFLLGEFRTLAERDLKRFLAWSTLGQVGEIAIVFGIGSKLAVAAGLMHVVNHAAMKTLLFFAAGQFILRAGFKRLDDLAGIGRAMPLTGAAFGLGLFAIMGLPPFGGFVSKFMIILATADAGMPWLGAIVLAGSLVGAVAYTRVIKIIYFEPWRGPAVAEAPASMLAVVGMLAAVIVVNGVRPDLVYAAIAPVAVRLVGGTAALPALGLDWSLAAIAAFVGAAIVFLAGRGSAIRSGVLAVATMAVVGVALVLEADRTDALSLAFALLVVGVGALNLTNAIGYMAHGHDPHRFFAAFTAMIGGLVGLCGARDLFGFFAFWEIMSSWTLYLAIIHEGTRQAVREGTKYFLFNLAGAGILFLGVAVLAASTGSLAFDGLAERVALLSPTTFVLAAGLMAAGFVMKAAQIPLRIDWQMHPAPAPTPVSGYISAVLLKAGPYGLLKLLILFGGTASLAPLAALPDWMPAPNLLLSAIAGTTMLYAGAMAVVETGIKRLLIYSTVAQLGYVLMGVAVGGDLGTAAAMAHAVQHMLLKNVLFLAAGGILAQAHLESLDDLGGLARRMPVTFTLFLLSGLSLAGIPPLAGFSTKWMLYQAAFEGGHWILGLAALMASLFTLAAVLKFAHAAFMGEAGPAAARLDEAPAVMLVPMLILSAASLLTGVMPGLLLVPIAAIQTATGLPAIAASWTGGLPGGWHPATMTVAIAAAGVLAAGYLAASRRGRVTSHVHACGVTEIEGPAMHMPASGLYPAPTRLIRTALFAPHTAGSHAHD